MNGILNHQVLLDELPDEANVEQKKVMYSKLNQREDYPSAKARAKHLKRVAEINEAVRLPTINKSVS